MPLPASGGEGSLGRAFRSQCPRYGAGEIVHEYDRDQPRSTVPAPSRSRRALDAHAPAGRVAEDRSGAELPLILVFVYGFILWTIYLSFTNSKTFPSYSSPAARAYQRLWSWTFDTDPPSSWYTSITNMGIFGLLYIVICLALGLFLAILLDQKIRGEGVLRPIYLYPMALSFIVTGVAWKWFLDPGLGLEQTCTTGAGRASISTGSRTRMRDLHAWSSPASGRPPASSWRCSSPACAASTARS